METAPDSQLQTSKESPLSAVQPSSMLDSDPVLSDPASLEPKGTDSARTILSKQSDHVRNRWNSDPHEQKSLNSENVLLVLQNVMKTKSSFFRRLFSEREHATAERFLSLPN